MLAQADSRQLGSGRGSLDLPASDHAGPSADNTSVVHAWDLVAQRRAVDYLAAGKGMQLSSHWVDGCCSPSLAISLLCMPSNGQEAK